MILVYLACVFGFSPQLEVYDSPYVEVKSELPPSVAKSSVIIKKSGDILGSGVVAKVSGEPLLITAKHVVEALPDEVCTGEGQCFPLPQPLVLGRGEGLEDDWAILPIPEGMSVKAAQMRHSPLEVGEGVWIQGNPLGLSRVVSRGVVARLENGLFWVDAFAYFGSSGGGVFDDKGQLIGIVVALPGGPYGTMDLPICVKLV